jgi:hypothetical protein
MRCCSLGLGLGLGLGLRLWRCAREFVRLVLLHIPIAGTNKQIDVVRGQLHMIKDVRRVGVNSLVCAPGQTHYGTHPPRPDFFRCQRAAAFKIPAPPVPFLEGPFGVKDLGEN